MKTVALVSRLVARGMVVSLMKLIARGLWKRAVLGPC